MIKCCFLFWKIIILIHFVSGSTNKIHQSDIILREDDIIRLKGVQRAAIAADVKKLDPSEVHYEFDAKLCKFLLV